MLPFNLHIIRSEHNVGEMLESLEIVPVIFFSTSSRNLGYESELARAALRASLIDLKSLKSS